MAMRRLVTAVLCAVTALVPAATRAGDDPVRATPGVYRILHESDQVRVLEVTYAPGQRENWHGHPRYIVYVVDPGDGKIRTENAQGEIHEFDLETGESMLLDPVEKHRGMNPGTRPVRILAIELNQD
jgi:mannose-6-phosphate isomerase-like protein (cupin superfamily)